MATSLARISRKALTSTISPHRYLLNHTLSAEASTKSITLSPDRVKWDYRGQRQLIHWASGSPRSLSMPMWHQCRPSGQVTVCDGASFGVDRFFGAISTRSHVIDGPFVPSCLMESEGKNMSVLLGRAGLPAETSIERFVTIGAYSLLRSCTIEPECIIGQHSILMEGSLVETHSILEAGSVVPQGGEFQLANFGREIQQAIESSQVLKGDCSDTLGAILLLKELSLFIRGGQSVKIAALVMSDI
ncbi:hypothetical protein GH714_024504 [Hevea brasiliensis]|uniref:Uncharacterized protein n=1 Tax=Hevea brasiliensis TaxID=3981 RepID=A0A6A6MF37_HEVBR|nr:hypothetical protein GH714_024504 [Hevea brasiliensis]